MDLIEEDKAWLIMNILDIQRYSGARKKNCGSVGIVETS